jgi:hypothetical protein
VAKGRVLRERESTVGNPREVLRSPEDRQIAGGVARELTREHRVES